MKKMIYNQNIDYKIYLVRGQRVILDEDLAKLECSIKQFVGIWKDFLKTLCFNNLKSQIVISSWGGRRKMPFAFTEHGTVMLASVLRSKRAIDALKITSDEETKENIGVKVDPY